MNIQQALLDFDATIKATPDLTDDELLQKFPEFENDVTKLSAARDYSATLNSDKYSGPEEFNHKFPEFFEVKKKDGTTESSQEAGPLPSPSLSIETNEDPTDPIFKLLKAKKQAVNNKANRPVVAAQVDMSAMDADFDSKINTANDEIKKKAKTLGIDENDLDAIYTDFNTIDNIDLSDAEVMDLYKIKKEKPVIYSRRLGNLQWIDAVRGNINTFGDKALAEQSLGELDAFVQEVRQGSYGEGSYKSTLEKAARAFDFVKRMTADNNAAFDKAVNGFKKDLGPALGRALASDPSAVKAMRENGNDFATQLGLDFFSIIDKSYSDQSKAALNADFTDPNAKQAKQRRASDIENAGLNLISAGINEYAEVNGEKLQAANKFYEDNKPRLDEIKKEINDLKAEDDDTRLLASTMRLYSTELERFKGYKKTVDSGKATKDEIDEYNYSVNLLNNMSKRVNSLSQRIQNPELTAKVEEYNTLADQFKTYGSSLENGNKVSQWVNYVNQKRDTQFSRFPVKALDQEIEDMQNLTGASTNDLERGIINVANFGSNAMDFVQNIYESMFYNDDEKLESDFSKVGMRDYERRLVNFETQDQSLRQRPVITVASPELRAELDKIQANANLSKEEKYMQSSKLIREGRANGQVYDATNPKAGEYNITAKTVSSTVAAVLPQLLTQYGIMYATGGLGAVSKLKSLGSLAMSTALQGYSDYYKDGVEQGLSNPNGYALSHTLVDVFSEVLFTNDLKVLQETAKGMKGVGAEFIKNLTQAEFDALRKGSKSAFKDWSKAVKSGLGSNLEESVLEEGILAQGGGNIVDRELFQMQKNPLDDVEETSVKMSLGMLPMTALGIPMSVRKANLGNKLQMYNVGVDPSASIEAVKEMLENNELTQPEADQRIAMINSLQKVVKEMPKTYADGNPLRDIDKATVAFNQFIINQSKVNAQGLPEAQVAEIKKVADEAAKENAEILGTSFVSPLSKIESGKRLFNDPNPETAEISKGYKQAQGFDTGEGERIMKLDEDYAKQIADAYEAMQNNPQDPEVKSAYEALAKETKSQYDAIAAKGYVFEVYEGKGEPYRNSEEMIKDLKENKHLFILSTENDFGQTAITEEDRNNNPLLRDSGIQDVNGKPLLLNDLFRGVHDFFGHSERGNGFGAVGEENAWDVHARMFSPEARRAMTTETRGQNSWVNFGPQMRDKDGKLLKKGDPGFLSPTERKFAEQKIGLLPEEFSSIRETKSKTGLQVESLQKALQSTGVQVEVVDDLAGQIGQQGVGGVFVSEDGKILLDKTALENEQSAGRIIFHEGAHPVMNILRNTNKDLYDAVVAGVREAAKSNPMLAKAVAYAEKNYSSDGAEVVNDEAVVETIAMIADGTLDINTIPEGWKQQLIDFINKIAKVLGLSEIAATDVAKFKEVASKVAEALTKGRDVAEVVGAENVTEIQNNIEIGMNVGNPTQLRISKVEGDEVNVKGNFELSFVKPEDIIDLPALVKEIEAKGQKVWFWVADQLGRGMYYDKIIEGDHYLDAGPSFALDPKNRERGVIWATGKGEKWITDKINNSDYIFIISGSPTKSKLFNKRVAELTINRIKAIIGENNTWQTFKDEVLSVSKIGKINAILNEFNSFEELLSSPKRKDLLIEFDAQKEKKGTPLKALLEKYNAFVDYDELRDGFYKENNFQLNDVMLVLKPTGFGGTSEHSTYENDVLGEVVGVPNKKINAFDLMPKEFKIKYEKELSRTEQSQAVAPYGVGIRNVQARKAPNGQPSNLNEEQYKQVRTPEFKAWFGDWENDPENASKVVDENGEPRVVFHGTNNQFDEFKKDFLGSKNWNADSAYTGFFFAGDKSTSEAYTGMNGADLMGLNLGNSPIIQGVLDKYGDQLKKAEAAVRSVLDAEVEKAQKEYFDMLKPAIEKLKQDLAMSDEAANKFVESLKMKQISEEVFAAAARINKEKGNTARLEDVKTKMLKETEAAWMKQNNVTPTVMNLYLNIKNPYIYDFNNESENTDGLTTHIKEAKLLGADGVMFKNLADGAGKDDIFVAFEPNQIKSATDNSGAFSTTDNRIQARKNVDLAEEAGLTKQMTQDDKGNYLFYHYSPKKLKTIDPSKFGSNTMATGRDERPGVGISMYYTKPNTREANVPNDFGYVVRVPQNKVYPFNEDPLGLIDEAEAQFKKQYPSQAFDFNKQVGFVTKVAAEKGFPMTVAKWNGMLRAQTTEALTPEFYSRIKPGTMNQVEMNPELEKFKPGKKYQARVEDDMEDRGFAKTFPQRDPSVIAKISNDAKKYFAISNKQTAEEVNSFIAGENPEDVLDYLLAEPRDIPARVRIWMSGVIMDKIDEAIVAAKASNNDTEANRLAEKQAQLINQISPLATELGQAVQAFRRFYENSKGSAAMFNYFFNNLVSKIEKKAERTLTSEELADLETIAKKLQDAPQGLPKDEAAYELGNYIGGITPTSAVDIFQAIWYAHILSGVTTQATNFFANLWNTFAEGVVTGIRESFKSKSLMPFALGLKGWIDGASMGLVDGADILATGLTGDGEGGKYMNQNLLEYFDWRSTKVGKLAGGKVGKVLNIAGSWSPKLLKYVGRALAATDAAFARSNTEAIARMMAYSQAREEGAKDVMGRVREILANTTQNVADATQQATDEGYVKGTRRFKRRVYEIMERQRSSELNQASEDYGKKVTLNYEPEGFTRPLYMAALAVQNSSSFARLFVPFTRIIANLTENSLNYTPLGAIKAIVGSTNSEGGRRKLTADERADFAIKAAIGMSTFIVLAGLTGDDDDDLFDITANGTGNLQKNYELRKSGWRPYSIKLKSGRYISYKDWPIMPLLAALGAMHDADKYNKEEITNEAMVAMSGMANAIYDKSVMTGIQDFVEIFKPKAEYNQDTNVADRIISYAADQTSTMLVSNFTKQNIKFIQEAMETPVKAAKGVERIYRDIPVLNDGLNPILDVFGETVGQTTSERLLPVTIKRVPKDKLLSVINESGIFIGKPQSRDIVIDDETGDTRKMTDQEYYEYTKKAGQLTKQYLQEDWAEIEEALAIKNPTERQAELQAIIKGIVADARAEAMDMFYDAEGNVLPTKKEKK